MTLTFRSCHIRRWRSPAFRTSATRRCEIQCKEFFLPFFFENLNICTVIFQQFCSSASIFIKQNFQPFKLNVELVFQCVEKYVSWIVYYWSLTNCWIKVFENVKDMGCLYKFYIEYWIWYNYQNIEICLTCAINWFKLLSLITRKCINNLIDWVPKFALWPCQKYLAKHGQEQQLVGCQNVIAKVLTIDWFVTKIQVR